MMEASGAWLERGMALNPAQTEKAAGYRNRMPAEQAKCKDCIAVKTG